MITRKNDTFVAKIVNVRAWRKISWPFCLRRKAANFCHPMQHVTIMAFEKKYGTLFDLDSKLYECEDANSFWICWWRSLKDNKKEIIPYIGYLISCISYTNFFFLLQIFWILEKNGYKRNPNHKLERHSAKTRKTEFVYWTLWLGTGNTFIFMIINFNF